MEKIPRVTIGAIVFNDKGDILLLKSHKWHGKYIVPCGHVEFGETLVEAVKREVKEETNLDVEEVEFLILNELINSKEYYKEDKHFVAVNFTCKAKNKDIILNHEAEDFIWVKPKDALEKGVDCITEASIEKIIRN